MAMWLNFGIELEGYFLAEGDEDWQSLKKIFQNHNWRICSDGSLRTYLGDIAYRDYSTIKTYNFEMKSPIINTPKKLRDTFNLLKKLDRKYTVYNDTDVSRVQLPALEFNQSTGLHIHTSLNRRIGNPQLLLHLIREQKIVNKINKEIHIRTQKKYPEVAQRGFNRSEYSKPIGNHSFQKLLSNRYYQINISNCSGHNTAEFRLFTLWLAKGVYEPTKFYIKTLEDVLGKLVINNPKPIVDKKRTFRHKRKRFREIVEIVLPEPKESPLKGYSVRVV